MDTNKIETSLLRESFLTGSTCGDACWHAKEEVCRCSCGGKNHGILLKGDNQQPLRTRKIDGQFYELVAIIPYPGKDQCFMDSIKKERAEINNVLDDRFPGISQCAYGAWRREKYMPVLSRKVTDAQATWTECEALNTRPWIMIWSRPEGSKYLKFGTDHKAHYTTKETNQ